MSHKPSTKVVPLAQRHLGEAYCPHPSSTPSTHPRRNEKIPRLANLPVSGALYTDIEAKEMVPFSVAISADSYRNHLLMQQGLTVDGVIKRNELSSPSFKLPPPHCDSFIHQASPLTNADLLQLVDALLCNSSLTSLNLDHCGLDIHTCPGLITLLSQHPTLTSISLEGNQFGLHPDSQELRSLFQAIASKPNLPHLMHINLANNQFPPRSLELFSVHFLSAAPSVQSVDLRENDIGLRGGWALVDALRTRQSNQLTPVCELRIECDSMDEHRTSEAMNQGLLPQPNVPHTAAAHVIKPAFWDRLQGLLEENRLQRDMRVLKEEENQKKHEEDSKEPVNKVIPASSISLTSPTRQQSSPDSSSAPELLPLHSYHASLGRMVSELNTERLARHTCETELQASRRRETDLRTELTKTKQEVDELIKQFQEQQMELARERQQKKELEAAMVLAKTREATMVGSHAKQITSMQQRSHEDQLELVRLSNELRSVQSAREDERQRWHREWRSQQELAQVQLRGATQSHEQTLNGLERRMDILAIHRGHDLNHPTTASRPNSATASPISSSNTKTGSSPISSSNTKTGSSATPLTLTPNMLSGSKVSSNPSTIATQSRSQGGAAVPIAVAVVSTNPSTHTTGAAISTSASTQPRKLVLKPREY